MTRVIGGRVARDGETVTTPTLTRMAGHPAAATVRPGAGSVGLFTGGGFEAVEVGNEVWAVTDLELTNLDELHALTGVPRGRPGVLTALYARVGAQFVRHLRGGFAVALWDGRRQTLLLAVDHFSIKRLYWADRPDGLAFASRPSLLLAPDARIDPATVHSYLNFGFVPAPASILAGVQRLAPGHLLRARDGSFGTQPYWDLEYTEHPVGEQQAAAEMHRRVDAAVDRALRDALPKQVGTFLSGGTDSSTVLGLASRLTGERVGAFSIGFREAGYNELDYAGMAARHFGAAHHVKIVGPDDALEALPRIAEAYDEPFGNNSALGALLCAELAAECGVTRLLAGDGGDEIFGGNERYRTDRVFARYHDIPAAFRRAVLEPVLLGLPEGGARLLGRAQRYIRRANIPNPRRLYSWEFFFAQRAAELLTPEFRQAVDPEALWTIVQDHWDRAGAASELNRQLYLDLKLVIGDNDLLKVTRTAELAGMDVRFPLLDLSLVEWTATLPARFKLRGLEKRYLFKRAFRSLLPAEVLAKRKHGFGVPTSTWLRTPGRFRDHTRDILLSPRLHQRGYFLPGAVERVLRLHDADDSPYYGDMLWRVLMLELWHRHHFDQRRS